MRITRIYLRNYRVFEDELDLEVPPGLVGIYGPNGAGKSYLIESIRWTLFGKSRTSNDEIRTAGVNGDCTTEVEFEHEGHLYSVRRILSGINSTVRAEAWADRQQVCEGARDVAQYVHSILGMDDSAFRSSVFAEQNQVAAFSQQTPAKRRDLVLRLLGITPLDRARDEARRDSKDALGAYEAMRTVLPNLDILRNQAEDQSKLADEMTRAAQVASEKLTASRESQQLAETRLRSLDELAHQYNQLVTEGKIVRQKIDQASEEIARLDRELRDLADISSELVRLAPLAEGLEELELRIKALEAFIVAETDFGSVPEVEIPQEANDELLRLRQTEASNANNGLGAAKASLSAAQDELARAEQALERAGSLSTEHDCPLCGQELGSAFEQVQAHRKAELQETRDRVSQHQSHYEKASTIAAEAARSLLAEEKAFDDARKAREISDRHRLGREHALKVLEDARIRLANLAPQAASLLATGASVGSDLLKDWQEESHLRRKAASDFQRLSGRLDRQDVALSERESARARSSEASAQRQVLLEAIEALGYHPEERDLAHKAVQEAREQTESALRSSHSTDVAAEKALSEAGSTQRRLAEAQEQHEAVHSQAERARHLGRAADLLNNFRNSVVATVGPRLATQAADLFAELTDNEYDRLEVNSDNWEIQIRDAGRLYDMSRFSGSETDLANLALRVAISEHVRFQSGGAVGLLVLDEVFGPLDDERKDRMLSALERLKGHFRQVLVVTHASSVKEQLPNAIEVLKLPGRRATARVMLG